MLRYRHYSQLHTWSRGKEKPKCPPKAGAENNQKEIQAKIVINLHVVMLFADSGLVSIVLRLRWNIGLGVEGGCFRRLEFGPPFGCLLPVPGAIRMCLRTSGRTVAGRSWATQSIQTKTWAGHKIRC